MIAFVMLALGLPTVVLGLVLAVTGCLSWTAYRIGAATVGVLVIAWTAMLAHTGGLDPLVASALWGPYLLACGGGALLAQAMRRDQARQRRFPLEDRN